MIRLLLLFSLFLSTQLYALTDLEIRTLDSLNLDPSNIRVNQLGYGEDRIKKKAFVTAYENFQPTTGDDFYLINSVSKEIMYTGKLTDSGEDFARGSLNIIAYANSVTEAYKMESKHKKEHIYVADFSAYTTSGNYSIVCNNDTSHVFTISDSFYNDLYTSQLKFMAFQRCGEKTWAHEECHMHDGEDVGHDGEFTGGWHDLGDHIKFSLTLGYRSYMLALTATMDQLKNDSWNSEVSSNIGDGIPDMLYELKQVSQYIMNMYNASKNDGIWPDEMYHVVGDGDYDHNWWGRPEWQESVGQENGGRMRPVKSAMGAEVAAKFGATLAYFSKLWQPYDPTFTNECLAASIDLYENYILPNAVSTSGADHGSYYGSSGSNEDEIAAHVVALLYVTKDEFYKKELLENTINGSTDIQKYSAGNFKAGWFAAKGQVIFHPGGWSSDWDNLYASVLFTFKTLILNDEANAATFGFTSDEYNEYSIRTAHAMLKNLSAGGLIKNELDLSTGGNFMGSPYNLPNFQIKWGFNQYNLNMSIVGYLFDVAFRNTSFTVNDNLAETNEYKTQTTATFNGSSWLTSQADSHMDYLLGKNPWDISFIAGLGDKNLNHAHNRTANDEMLSDASPKYDYTVPIGGLYGGVTISGDTTLSLNINMQNFISQTLEINPHILLYSVLKMNDSKVTAVKDDRVPLVKNSKLSYAPNPVRDLLKFVSTYSSDTKGELQIISTDNKVLYHNKIESLKKYTIDIDVSSYEKGSYYILVKTSKRIIYRDLFYKN